MSGVLVGHRITDLRSGPLVSMRLAVGRTGRGLARKIL